MTKVSRQFNRTSEQMTMTKKKLRAITEMRAAMATWLKLDVMRFADSEYFLTGVMYQNENLRGCSSRVSEYVCEAMAELDAIAVKNGLRGEEEKAYYEQIEIFCSDGLEMIKKMLRGH